METLRKGKIMKVLSKDGIPKHNQVWMRDITYNKNMIQLDYPLILYYDNGNNGIKTSIVEGVEEDVNNLTVWTENSIYYIKKFTD